MEHFRFQPEGNHFLVDVQVDEEQPDELIFMFYCGAMKLAVLGEQEQGLMMAMRNHWVRVRRSSPNSFAFTLLSGPEDAQA